MTPETLPRHPKPRIRLGFGFVLQLGRRRGEAATGPRAAMAGGALARTAALARGVGSAGGRSWSGASARDQVIDIRP
jgi:hypothetical protein